MKNICIMKNILIMFLLLTPSFLFGQDFKFEETKEINMSKDALFSKTKMFISDKWNAPKLAIQNEDKDGGIIQVKSEKDFNISVGMGIKCEYIYEYSVKFRMKENKYRIEIYDVKCTHAAQVGLGSETDIIMIQPFEGDNAPDTKKMGKGISKKKAIEMMNELKAEFYLIFSSYNKYLGEEDDF